MKDYGVKLQENLIGYGGSVGGGMAGSVTGRLPSPPPGYQQLPRSNRRDPYLATVVDRLGRYMIVIQVMGKGYRPGFSLSGKIQYPYELIAVLHMDRIREAPPRIPVGPSADVAPNSLGVLRVVWESDQVPAGGQTLRSKKGQALARAKEEMRLAHIKEA